MFSKEEYDKLPDPAKLYCKFYMYWSEKLSSYVMCLDNARHFNHTTNANTTSRWYDREEARKYANLNEEQWEQVSFVEGFTVAARDIAKGEEITSNYLTDFSDKGGAGTEEFLHQ